MDTHTSNTTRSSFELNASRCRCGLRCSLLYCVDKVCKVTELWWVVHFNAQAARSAIVVTLFLVLIPVLGAHHLHAQQKPATVIAVPDTDSLTLNVLESDNEILDPRSYFYPFSLRPSDSLALWLRSALPADIARFCNIEEEFFPKLVHWVHNRWQHDSFNSIAAQSGSKEILTRAARGEKFTCVEYAKVLTDLLISFGYAARMTGLSRGTISSPALGARHVVSEVWSCTHRKWIMLDAQFGSYAVRNGTPLNVAEVQAAVRNRDSTVTLLVASDTTNLTLHLYDSTVYSLMLRNLDTFTDIPYVVNERVGILMLVPADRTEPLLFQGQVISNTQYTKKVEDLYASLGQVHMDLRSDTKDKSPEQFLLHPEYQVSVTTSYPFTRYLEVSVDGSPWKRVNEPRFRWTLHRGENTVSTRTVCYSGCTTKPAKLVVFYGLRGEYRKLHYQKFLGPHSTAPERD
jgi:hypothetical protein